MNFCTQWTIHRILLLSSVCFLLRWTLPLELPRESAILPGVLSSSLIVSLNSIPGAVPTTTSAKFRKLFLHITGQEFDHCIETLDLVAGNDKMVDPEEFILFLEMYSGRSLAFGDFEDLPASFILIFYTAACSFGDGCASDEEAKISLDDIEEAEGVLNMFCQSVKDVSAVQISVHFQFQIRFDDKDTLTIEQILMGLDDTGIKEKLELATEGALLNRFGCSNAEPQKHRGTVEADVGMPWSRSRWMENNASGDHFDDKDNYRREQSGNEYLSLHGIDREQCDYEVHAKITNMIESVCISDIMQTEVSNNYTCAVVIADLVVTSASLSQHRTASELRGVVMETLKSTFTQNQLL